MNKIQEKNAPAGRAGAGGNNKSNIQSSALNANASRITASEIADQLDAKRNGDGWLARCPSHQDKNPSLQISERTDGSVGIHCFAGCEFRDVIAALGIEAKQLFPQDSRNSPGKVKSRIVKIYDYTDAAGNLLFQVVRLEPKSFRQRRPHPELKNEYIWNTKGIKRVLYRLTEVMKAKAEGRLIIIAEGEEDGDSLRGLGFTATCNSGGAGRWESQFTESLAGARVVIIPDKDQAGRKHAELVRSEIKETAESVQVVELPDRNGRSVKDPRDWIRAGGTAEELKELIRNAPEWQPPPDDGRASSSLVNAQKGGRGKVPYRLIADSLIDKRYRRDGKLTLRFHLGQWWRFDGTCFRAMQLDDLRAAVMTHLRAEFPSHENRNVRDNVLANLQSFDTCSLPSWLKIPSWLGADANRHTDGAGWLAMKNGLLNITNLARRKRGEQIPDKDIMREKTPGLFSTFGLEYNFDPKAGCPMWLHYLHGVQPVEEDRIVLQKLAGLALIPDTSFNVAFFFFGDGGTGKGVYMYILIQLVGESNVCSLPLTQFNSRFSSWELTANLLNIIGDLPTEDSSSGGGLRHIEGMFKDVTDGGMVPVEHKHQEPGKAPAIARCIFAGNSLPHFSDRTNALWDRLRIIPFDQRFRGSDKEVRNLRQKIAAKELPGIFNWAVDGLAMLMDDVVFPEHSAGESVKLTHRVACDPERVFLEENYQTADTEHYYVETTKIYTEFREWCKDNGYKIRTEHTFSEAVRRVFKRRKEQTRTVAGRLTVYPGLKAIESAEDDGF